MTGEMEALARRAVACKGWRWMPGMRCLVGPLHAPYRYVTHDYAPPESKDVAFTDPFLPDLTDTATLGCLLALVREAWGNKHLWVDVGIDPAMWSLTVYSIGWACVDGEVPIPADIQAESEAGVLVAALEAAP